MKSRQVTQAVIEKFLVDWWKERAVSGYNNAEVKRLKRVPKKCVPVTSFIYCRV